MLNKNEMIQILDINKKSIPAQDSQLGTLILKTILYKKNDLYSCSQGIGDDEWIINNGTMLDYNQSTKFFSNIFNLKNSWR